MIFGKSNNIKDFHSFYLNRPTFILIWNFYALWCINYPFNIISGGLNKSSLFNFQIESPLSAQLQS